MRILTLLAALLAGGCAGVVKVPPYVVTTHQINQIASTYTDKNASWYEFFSRCSSPGNEAECLQQRRKIQAQLLLIVDHRYAAYEGGVLAGNAKAEFYPNALRSTLEATATVINPASTKSILAGAAALTGTIQDSAQKAFYYEATATALVIQMRADRKAVLASLLESAKNAASDYWAYPIEDLIRDLNNYYRAGTLASAVSSLAEAAAGKEEEADDELNRVMAL